MIYEKKYWSVGEYTHKDGTPYEGYIGIYDRKGYVFDTEEELDKLDSYSAQINSSDLFYDRILDETIELPYDKQDVQFAANDFLSTSTMKDILIKLQANNDYIFKNAIISNTLLPATDSCEMIATKYDKQLVFIGADGQEYKEVTSQNKQTIELNFILNPRTSQIKNEDSYPLKVGDKPLENYGEYYKVPKVVAHYDLENGILSQHNLKVESSTKTALDPTFYPQYDNEGNASEAPYNFNDINHAEMTITKVEDAADGNGRKLHLMIFLVFKDKVVIFKYIYRQYDNPVEQIEAVNPDYDNAEGEVNFNEGSNDILVLDKVDPSNRNSLKFLNLKDIELHGNYMYLVDEKLNMVLRYDITYLLHDESDIAWNLKSIRLIDNLQGDGKVRDNIYFNGPTAIAVDDDWIYVADKGNHCVKKYTSSFDYQSTLRNGNFINHNVETVAINPYAPTMEDGTKLTPGTLWVFSTTDKLLYVTVIDPITNNTVYFKQIQKIELIKDQYTWDEEFKSVKFSFTNSNYYYLSTTKRVYKLHLSKPLYPFASLSYFKQRALVSSMVWQSIPYPWHTLPDGLTDEDMKITWSYRPQKTSAEVLDNRAFCVCGIDSSDVIEYKANNDPDAPSEEYKGTKQQQFNGDLILHIGNLYDQSKVDTYIKRYGCKFHEIPIAELAKMIKASGIFLYLEPATFITSLSNNNMPCYIDEDLQDIKIDEYVNSITFNAHIYKVIYNLINIKNTLLGRFQGAYNMDSIMVFDQLILDNFFQQLKLSNKDDYFIHDNEAVGIIVNRVFENVWNIQHEMLEKIKAKYISTPSFTNNTFRII